MRPDSASNCVSLYRFCVSEGPVRLIAFSALLLRLKNNKYALTFECQVSESRDPEHMTMPTLNVTTEV